MDEQDSRSVTQVVSVYLHHCRPSGVTLVVDEAEVHQVRGQWYVPVHPSVEPVEQYKYYKALTDVEMELDEREHLNVFLVPSDPQDSQAAQANRQEDENGACAGPSADKPERRLRTARRAIVRKAGEPPLTPKRSTES